MAEKSKDRQKGQMWSVDVIIGIVIFVSIITIFYFTMSGTDDDPTENLRANADTILIKFTQDPVLRLIEGDNVINKSKLAKWANKTYAEQKDDMGIEGDFCIYLEDDQGRIIPVNNKTSIGKGDINVSGQPCGSFV